MQLEGCVDTIKLQLTIENRLGVVLRDASVVITRQRRSVERPLTLGLLRP